MEAAHLLPFYYRAKRLAAHPALSSWQLCSSHILEALVLQRARTCGHGHSMYARGRFGLVRRQIREPTYLQTHAITQTYWYTSEYFAALTLACPRSWMTSF
jgi:hypothetical protein